MKPLATPILTSTMAAKSRISAASGWNVWYMRSGTKRTRYPHVIAGERACPPEDVGGPYGYADFCAAIEDPSNDAHDELLDWVGGEFDPDWFDLDEVNEYFEFGP